MLLGLSIYTEIEKGIYPTLFVLIPAFVWSLALLWSPRKRLPILFGVIWGGTVFILVGHFVRPPILSVEDIRPFAGLTEPWSPAEFWQLMPLNYKVWAFAYPALTLVVMAQSLVVIVRHLGLRVPSSRVRTLEDARIETE
jgi:hypothetical protein